MRIKPARSLPVIPLHLGKAAFAAAIAFSASAASRLATCAMMSLLAGLLIGKVAPDPDFTHLPLMKDSSLNRLGSLRSLRISIVCIVNFK